jgi:hypothetical protein
MPTHTALDLITASLKRLGVLSGIETPAADLAADGLDRLNSLIESWATESLNIYASLVVDTPLSVGKASYSIGVPGGEPMLEQGWARTQTKLLPSSQPTHYYYNATYPLGTITLWPVLNAAGAMSLRLYLPQLLTAWATLTTPVDLPIGYYRALRDNLAVELAPELDRPMDGNLFQIAVDAKAAIKRVNTRPRLLSIDAGLRGCGTPRGAYNWMTDT